VVCDDAGDCVGCNQDSDCGPGRGCTANHACQDLCNDGIVDFGETGVDCGGPCQPCPNGQQCANGADCASGFCTDGVCCISACGSPCETCNQTATPGSCVPLPIDTVDPGLCDAMNGGCGADCACGANGQCLLADNSLCSGNADCASGNCGGAGRCKP
jgi:hypothetical protein